MRIPCDMNPSWLSCGCALIITTAGWAAALSEEVIRLTYGVETKITTSADQQEIKTVVEPGDEVVVWLGAGRFAVQSAGNLAVYDVDNEKLWFANLDRQAQTRFSLFADVAFRVAELQNVIWIHGGLAKAGLEDQNDPTQVRELADLETRFGIPWPHEVEDLPAGQRQVARPQPGHWDLQRGNILEASAQVAEDAAAFDAEHVEAYAKWLLYTCPMHPAFWDALSVEVDRPLDRLDLKVRDGFKLREMSYRLKEVEADAVWPSAFDDFPQTVSANFPEVPGVTPIVAWVERIAHGPDHPDLPARPTEAQATAAADDALERGRPFDAFLALIGFSLQEGVRFDGRIGEIMADHAGDPQIAAYLALQREEEAAIRFDRIRAIDRTGLEHAHILDIFTANEATAARDRDATYLYFARALEVNPHITGVWHDLAGLANSNYDTYTAWTCIQTARRLKADHPMLARIDDYERRLREDFPRFFGDDPRP